MRTIYNVIGLSLAVCLLGSCVRKNDVVEPTPPPEGGKGGHATLAVTPQHHEKNIDDCRIYIKYAAVQMPNSLKDFDDSGDVAPKNGRPMIEFTDLRAGDYFFYAIGKDYSLDTSHNVLQGVAHFKVVDTLERTYDVYMQIDDAWHHQDK